MWGCVKAPLGNLVLPKAFLRAHFLMGERGFERLFSGHIFNSSPIPGRVMVRVAQKERRQRVRCHVGLREGSPGEFICPQSLPLGELMDGRKWL